MGADTLASNSYGYAEPRNDVKIFQLKDMLIGFTTSYRMGQLLMYKLQIPEHPKEMSNHQYFSTLFIDAVRELFKKEGFSVVENNNEHGGEFLIGYKGELFHIYDDFQVAQSSHNFDACGSGMYLALGALNALHEFKNEMTPKEYILHALRAAEKFNAYVRSPFIVKSLEE